jgi:hypothetical protein
VLRRRKIIETQHAEIDELIKKKDAQDLARQGLIDEGKRVKFIFT